MVWWIATLVQVGIYVGTALLSALLNRNSRQTNTPGEPQFPKADAQAPVPVVYGTTRVGINVVYKARVTTGENTVRNGALSFGWSSTHIGYFYYLDLLATVCHGPVDALHEIYVDGTKKLSGVTNRVPLLDSFGVSYTPTDAVSPALPAYTASTGVWNFTITAGDLLGGKLSRGGIGAGGDGASTGQMRFQPGTGFLIPDSALETLAGTDLPVYPDVCTVAFEDNFYFGNSEQLPGIEFVVSRTAAWAPGMGTGYIGNNTANAGHGANPSAVLYDLLTNATYGLGLPASDIDAGSFVTLAHATDKGLDASAALNVPISFVLTDGATGKSVIGDLLRTLDGVLYTDPETGLLCVRLLRDTSDAHYGYDIFNEILIGEDVIRSLEWSESAPDAQVNEVVVEFTDRDRDYTKNTVTARNVAAIQALGRVESRTVSFLGVQEADLAMRLAQRELRSLSTSLGHATIELDRTGYLFTPGQFFTLFYTPRNFSGKIMRVVEVHDAANGGVTIQAVEDIYSSPPVSFEVETTPEPTPVTPQGTITPWVQEDASASGSTGTLTLFVYDPSGVVTSVEFQSTTGRGTPSGYAADTYPYAATVTLDPYADSTIDYRVSYTDANGATQTIARTVVFPIDADTAADAQSAEFVLAASNANVPNSRVLTDTASVTWDFSTPGEAKATATGGGGGGADPAEPYTTWDDPTALTNSRKWVDSSTTAIDVSTAGEVAIEVTSVPDEALPGEVSGAAAGVIHLPFFDYGYPIVEKLKTIPSAATEIHARLRRAALLAGMGTARLVANVRSITTGDEVLRCYYSTDGGTTWTAISGGDLPLSYQTGVVRGDWFAVPNDMQGDVDITLYVLGGDDPQSARLSSVALQASPTTRSGGATPPPAGGGGGGDVTAGLFWWYDAQDMGVFSDGDPVPTWPDQSGNANDASAATGTATYQPHYHTGVINGHPGVLFHAGTGNERGFTMPGTFNPTEAHLFIVSKVVATSRPYQVGPGGFSVYPEFPATTDGSGVLKDTFGSSVQRNLGAIGIDTVTNGWLYHAHAKAGLWEGDVNDVSLLFDPTNTTSFGGHKLGMWLYGGVSVTMFQGYIGEFRVYSGPLTSTEVDDITAFLADKWDITL
jgi:hypothetical protein